MASIASNGEQSSLLDIQLTNIEFIDKGAIYPGKPHIHRPSRTFNSVVLNVQGKGRYTANEQCLDFNVGDFFFLRSNVLFRHECLDKGSHVFIYVNFNTAYDDIFNVPPFSPMFMLQNRAVFEGDFQKILSCYENKDIGYLPRCREILYRILNNMIGILIKDHSLSPQYDRVRPAIRYIHANYMCEISMDHLASLCNLSVRQLNRCFQSVYNKAPHEYLTEVRLKVARELLQNTTNTIGEIAERTGYNSIFNFSHAFKQFYGISPRDWQNHGQ
jgi:AraC-like DNA-binding protein